MKFEAVRIHIFSDVFVAVAVVVAYIKHYTLKPYGTVIHFFT